MGIVNVEDNYETQVISPKTFNITCISDNLNKTIGFRYFNFLSNCSSYILY